MIFQCKPLAERVLLKCQRRIELFPTKPCLAVIQVGDNPASNVYVRNKGKACEEAGVTFNHIHFDESITENNLLANIKVLNEMPNVTAIMVQEPLPKHINSSRVVSAIDPNKDADGFHSTNLGDTVKNLEEAIQPCTPKAVMHILKYMHVDLQGKNVVVIGRSNIVGKPLANMLINKGATVTVCNSHTVGLRDYTIKADVVISAVGSPEFLNHSFFKEGVVIVDVGINRRPIDNKLCGDILLDDQMNWTAEKITPVPGGVGPMTVAMLIQNTVELYERGLRNGIYHR